MSFNHRSQRGAVTGSLIAAVLLGIVAVGLVVLSVWLYLQYTDQKTNVDGKVAVAVADAKKEQADSDAMKFAEEEKKPYTQFVGPDDYGRVTLNYPKTWSLYVSRDIKQGGDFQAYLSPVFVPPVGSSSQRFALRVFIQNRSYQDVVAIYSPLIRRGDLKSSVVTTNGETGTRLDGSFSKDIRGAVVIFKVRDKTLLVFTDADTFKKDFNTVVVPTIKFNA